MTSEWDVVIVILAVNITTIESDCRLAQLVPTGVVHSTCTHHDMTCSGLVELQRFVRHTDTNAIKSPKRLDLDIYKHTVVDFMTSCPQYHVAVHSSLMYVCM